MNQFPAVASNNNPVLNQVEHYRNLRDGALLPWVLQGSADNFQARDTQIAQAVEDAITAERNRLARELHDAVTQNSLRCEPDGRGTPGFMGYG